MDFKDSIKQLSERVQKLKEQILTEEATKNAFIMPFLQVLGYDVFNPLEVVPEMDCDLIKKKGEKIDYAIMLDGEPTMLIECKHWKQDLSLHDNQLQKYFVASKAKFGVLTNGVLYRFYTDLEKTNIMDTHPFLEINLEEYKDSQIEELKKFHKSYFDINTILNSASELKYMIELRNIISSEFNNPSPDFVKYLGKQAYSGVFNAKMIEQFTPFVKHSISSYINDVISERLKCAIKEEEVAPTQVEVQPEPTQESKIITTSEEIEAFYIVKSILRGVVAPENIIYKDSITRFSIFLASNKGQTICQFRLDGKKKTIAFQTGSGDYETLPLNAIDEIYNYADKVVESAQKCLNKVK